MVIPSIIPHFLVTDPDRIVWLLGGYLMAQLWEAAKAKIQDFRQPGTHHQFQRLGALGSVLVVFGAINIWIAAKTEQNYKYTKDVAEKSASCWVSFADNISARSNITTDNDRLTKAQIKAVDGFLVSLSQVRLENTTPAQQVEKLRLSAAQAHGVVGQILSKLDANEAERAMHPLKVPACRLAR